MLLIHWSKQNNTADMLKQGIRTSQKTANGQKGMKGVWCYPFTRNSTLNTNWKRNLKSWKKETANYNGFVFRLVESDFPIHAGEFAQMVTLPESTEYLTYRDFIASIGKEFSPEAMAYERKDAPDLDWLDHMDFEIVIPHAISPNRIIKVIRDRG